MTDIINLPNWLVVKTETGEDDYRVTVKYNVWPRTCPKCGVDNPNLNRHGTRPQTFMDLPVHGKRVGLQVIRQIYCCLECKSAWMELLPDMAEDHYMTQRLLEYIQTGSLKRPFTWVSEQTGVAESTVRRIFRQYVKALDKKHEVDAPAWLGIDEVHLANKPRCVLVNVLENTVVDMLKNRNKSTLRAYLQKMPGRKETSLVVMDMWGPYRDVIRELCPGAKIVIDKFHVVRMANESLERVRKGLRESLTDAQRRKLKGDRFILLRRRADLNPEQAFLMETWTNGFPRLGKAYELKEDFFTIWDKAKDSKDALKRYNEWEKDIPEDMKDAFKPLTTAVGNWSVEIFAYFDVTPRVTNAYTEAINGVAKVINRLGRGYSFEAIRAKMLYNGGLRKHIKKTFRSNWDRPGDTKPHGPLPREALSFDGILQYDGYEINVDVGVSIPKLLDYLRESSESSETTPNGE